MVSVTEGRPADAVRVCLRHELHPERVPLQEKKLGEKLERNTGKGPVIIETASELSGLAGYLTYSFSALRLFSFPF